MSCGKPVPKNLDICDACFDGQKDGKRPCCVCGALTLSYTGACLNPDCKRNDLSLREAEALSP